jgi:catechol 2,3-dioxygenase-like lactoylglutathione lyase family enzyme
MRTTLAVPCIVLVALLGFGGPDGPPVEAQTPPEPAHFHHVHLNVVDPQKSVQFYSRHFGAVPIKYGGAADAVFVERSFIFFTQVPTPADSRLASGIWHIGWGGMDVVSEAAWLKNKGVEIHTPPTPLGQNFYTYLYGADRELIEIYSGEQNHRFNHVHLLATDVNATSQWYADHLGLALNRREVPKPTSPNQWWINGIRVDNVTMYVFGSPATDPVPTWWRDPPMKSIEPTRGRVIDHIAFSYPAIEPVLERLTKAGVRIVEPIATRDTYKLKSFFVLGPDGVLIEVVEAKPIPDASWQK